MGTVGSPSKSNEIQQKNGVVLGLVAVAVVLLTAGAWWRVTSPSAAINVRHFEVSQRDREFKPFKLAISKGDVVRIVNDDGDLSHHAYVAAPSFNFDSGDQEPGRDVLIAFDVPGTFNVLCGIHPKMRLTVTVK